MLIQSNQNYSKQNFGMRVSFDEKAAKEATSRIASFRNNAPKINAAEHFGDEPFFRYNPKFNAIDEIKNFTDTFEAMTAGHSASIKFTSPEDSHSIANIEYTDTDGNKTTIPNGISNCTELLRNKSSDKKEPYSSAINRVLTTIMTAGGKI